jgi:hypothetical protein
MITKPLNLQELTQAIRALTAMDNRLETCPDSVVYQIDNYAEDWTDTDGNTIFMVHMVVKLAPRKHPMGGTMLVGLVDGEWIPFLLDSPVRIHIG